MFNLCCSGMAPLALDNRALEVLGCGEREIKGLGRIDLLGGLAGVGFLAGLVVRGAVLYEMSG